MPGQSVEGVVWARPEAADALGRRPGSTRSVVLAVLGCVSVAVGVALGTNVLGPAAPPTAPATPADAPGGPSADYLAQAGEATCSDVGATIPADRVPAQGLPEASVVALFRAEAVGQPVQIVPRAHVLTSEEQPDGSVRLSVLVRLGPPGQDRQVADVLGADAAGALSATVLYGVDPYLVLDECEGKS